MPNANKLRRTATEANRHLEDLPVVAFHGRLVAIVGSLSFENAVKADDQIFVSTMSNVLQFGQAWQFASSASGSLLGFLASASVEEAS